MEVFVRPRYHAKISERTHTHSHAGAHRSMEEYIFQGWHDGPPIFITYITASLCIHRARPLPRGFFLRWSRRPGALGAVDEPTEEEGEIEEAEE